MIRFIAPLLLLISLAAAFPAELRPSISSLSKSKPAAGNKTSGPRKLQGRFLHITDIHPDPFYTPNTATDEENVCHRGSGNAGVLGSESAACDSPLTLVDATFDWIKHNLRDKIDFVVWTGDSARHDNDEEQPRTQKQVVGLNEMLVNKFVDVFGKDDNLNDPDPTNDFIIPIVPTLGNNDIVPHNIFLAGPNEWTKTYLDVWNKFIPEEQRHSFAQGAWFFTEVIPDKLAVFSLNTLYFFTNNAAVDGCDAESEPGYQQMEWLRVQLQFLRQRGMKAIITGHVPPARTDSKQSWDETCWQKYTLWMRNYRDVVVGAMYGHMDLDHFFYHDYRDLKYDFLELCESHEVQELDVSNDTWTIESKADYLGDLRDAWTNLPVPPAGMSYSKLDVDETVHDEKKKKKKKGKGSKKSKEQKRKQFLKDVGGKYAERYSITLVSPSVLPKYYPTLRVIEYNISGLEDVELYSDMPRTPNRGISTPLLEDQTESHLSRHETSVKPLADHLEQELTYEPTKEKKKPKKPPFTIPKKPSSSAPPGPAYSPQTFTFLSYKQYFSNLTRINEELSKSGLPAAEYFGLLPESKKKPQKPHKPHYKNFNYEVEYDTKKDGIYKLKDLTVKSFLGLAEKISQDEPGKKDVHEEAAKHNVWHTFLQRAFVMTKNETELKKFS